MLDRLGFQVFPLSSSFRLCHALVGSRMAMPGQPRQWYSSQVLTWPFTVYRGMEAFGDVGGADVHSVVGVTGWELL